MKFIDESMEITPEDFERIKEAVEKYGCKHPEHRPPGEVYEKGGQHRCPGCGLCSIHTPPRPFNEKQRRFFEKHLKR